jgi:hypothetical protein
MNDKHPITPPPELVQQWCDEDPGGFEMFDRLATKAARWGADRELEACCKWTDVNGWDDACDELRAARRPAPPSLKEQALEVLNLTQKGWGLAQVDLDTIRRALEALPND